jgi:hypothetical protein
MPALQLQGYSQAVRAPADGLLASLPIIMYAMSSVVVWDIETIPDIKGFAAANGHSGKSDDYRRRESTSFAASAHDRLCVCRLTRMNRDGLVIPCRWGSRAAGMAFGHSGNLVSFW